MLNWLLFLSMILCTIAANVLIKTGSNQPNESKYIFGVLNNTGLAGLIIFGCAALLYVVVIAKIPLNLAQSLMASQFVGVILASYFFLGETIPPIRMVGILTIVIGILIVSFSIEY